MGCPTHKTHTSEVSKDAEPVDTTQSGSPLLVIRRLAGFLDDGTVMVNHSKRIAQAIGRRRKDGSPAGPRLQRMLGAWFTTADPDGFAQVMSTMFSALKPNVEREFHLTKVSLAGIY